MGHRILVIDDSADLALVMRMQLQRAGHEVITADNGRRGLRTFYETRPDLVVLDIRMPELDGWATLERIRDLADVPVLIVSGQNPAPEKLETPAARPRRVPAQAGQRPGADPPRRGTAGRARLRVSPTP